MCVAAPPGFRLLDCITNFVFMFSKRVKSCNGSRTVARTVRDTLTGVPQTYLVRSRTDSSVFGTQSFTVRKKSVQRRAALPKISSSQPGQSLNQRVFKTGTCSACSTCSYKLVITTHFTSSIGIAQSSNCKTYTVRLIQEVSRRRRVGAWRERASASVSVCRIDTELSR